MEFYTAHLDDSDVEDIQDQEFGGESSRSFSPALGDTSLEGDRIVIKNVSVENLASFKDRGPGKNKRKRGNSPVVKNPKLAKKSVSLLQIPTRHAIRLMQIATMKDPKCSRQSRMQSQII